MTAAAPRDPSRHSYYVTDALYRALIADFAGWQDDARAVPGDVGLVDRDRLEHLDVVPE